ncbi:hypothetical protein KIH86_06715 [Paenibacillus sp. HN-1]|uniref:hypothetical protein n=1 Tax=Paenibacillus TaxID=44249 RepID=UPI001CA7E714|nr:MULTISPECIES: hypothetical protein [Paenibacillus]MBY9077967.1 hypothetical protein [Paenibacillus sp. CGMCC 1.18879]MBY9083929.1 hypothetical protein [Paenibacillus sinensis]
MSRTYLFERRNHVPSSDLQQIKHGFYQELLTYCEDHHVFIQRKELLQQRLSEGIEQEPEVRIAYIRLQQGIRKGQIHLGKIPKADQIPPEIIAEALSLDQAGSELKQRHQELGTRFKSECKTQEQELYKLFRQQSSVQNALLLTNYEMYCSLNKSYSSKKSGKVWKIMMRSFAKTAPLSSFTSIYRGQGTGEESRISFAQWILLHWFELWLLLPEVIRASRYRVEYRDQEGTLLVECSAGPEAMEPGLYIRTKRKYRLKAPAAATIKPGSIVSLDELALMWNESMETMTAKAVHLLGCGYIKNTLDIESEPLTLESFIETVSAFRTGSSMIKALARHLEAIHLLSGQLEQTHEVPQREKLLEIAQRHVNRCCELLRWKGKYPVNPFNEDSYAGASPGPSIDVEPFHDPLAEWAGVLPIFDNRLKFRLYMENHLHDMLPVPYASVQQSMSRHAEEYEQHVALNRTCRGSVFENAPAVAQLEDLRDQYRAKLAPAESGKDVALQRADLASLEAGLEALQIRQPAAAGFWLQESGTGKLVVNDCKNSYLAYSIYHLPESHDAISERVKALFNCGERARLIPYSPSCGFNPNMNGFAEGNSLAADLRDAMIIWNGERHSFELQLQENRGVPLYTGTLAPACLPEDYRNLALLSQSGFITGTGLDYNELTIDECRQIGRISYGELILQRRKTILHEKLFAGVTQDFDGYRRLHELLQIYHAPLHSFIRLFPVRQGMLHIEYGESGLHKPIFLDAEEPQYCMELLKHMDRCHRQYGELAVVFEEALPDPYDNEYAVEYVYEMQEEPLRMGG